MSYDQQLYNYTKAKQVFHTQYQPHVTVKAMELLGYAIFTVTFSYRELLPYTFPPSVLQREIHREKNL